MSAAPTEAAVSFAQEGRFNTPRGSAVWNIPFALRIEGPLAPEILERCLGEVVRRHRILRSEIRIECGLPRLIICDFGAVRLPVVDVEPLVEAMSDPHKEILRLQVDEACLPFDFPRGPLFRFKLLRMSESQHILLLTFHHSVFDGRWSLAVLIRELCALYEAFENGRSSALPELSIQYYDYARWQRERYCGDILERTLARWRKRFGDEPPVIRLPADYPRPPTRTFRGESAILKFSPPLVRSLKGLCRREGVTLFTTLLAVWTALLCEVSAQTKIVVGTTIATRSQPGTRDLIGNFVNFLPVATDLSGNPGFRELLMRVREALLEAYADPEFPFELLASTLDPTADSCRPPLCQVFFAWHGPTPPPQRVSGMMVSLMRSAILTSTCKADVHVHVSEECANEITVEAEFSTDLFERGRIDQLLRCYQRMLEAAAAQFHPLAEPARFVDTGHGRGDARPLDVV